MKNKSCVVLIGHKSSGKTFFGKLLAEKLELPFIDTDELIEQLYEKKYLCREIYTKIGEKAFRLLEKIVIESINPLPSVVAVGGGAILHSAERLKVIGQLIYLEIDEESLKERIFSQTFPCFLDPKEPVMSFNKMYQDRKLMYEKICSAKVEGGGKNSQQILEELECIVSEGLLTSLLGSFPM